MSGKLKLTGNGISDAIKLAEMGRGNRYSDRSRRVGRDRLPPGSTGPTGPTGSTGSTEAPAGLATRLRSTGPGGSRSVIAQYARGYELVRLKPDISIPDAIKLAHMKEEQATATAAVASAVIYVQHTLFNDPCNSSFNNI